MKNAAYIVITPVRDEAEYVGKTIDSMVRQTILPQQWVIVDDGSTDQTSLMIDAASEKHSWIHAVHRLNRGFRKSGGGVIEAFYEGYSLFKDEKWDYLVKLDGDLSFDPDYFEKCLAYFEADLDIGVAGGTVCAFKDGKLKVDSAGDPPFHVRGATKIYRRSCWEKINPLVKAPGWDTIDEVKANLYGWTTRTFSDLIIVQLKSTGGVDGKWSNWFKNGRANFITGYHPAFMLAKCAKRTIQKPVLLASIALLAGYCSGYLKNIPQEQDRKTIRYLRKQQIRRLFLRSSIYG